MLQKNIVTVKLKKYSIDKPPKKTSCKSRCFFILLNIIPTDLTNYNLLIDDY